MKITLTDTQKKELEIQHDKICDGRIRERIKAVLFESEGCNNSMISEARRIYETTVKRHLNDYTLSAKLTLLNRGSLGYLTAIQTMNLIKYITDHTYHHRHKIINYVIEQFGVQCSLSGMNKWL